MHLNEVLGLTTCSALKQEAEGCELRVTGYKLRVDCGGRLDLSGPGSRLPVAVFVGLSRNVQPLTRNL